MDVLDAFGDDGGAAGGVSNPVAAVATVGGAVGGAMAPEWQPFLTSLASDLDLALRPTVDSTRNVV